MTRLLFVAVGAVLVAILAVPLILSMRFDDDDRYKEEMAEWHVRWADARSIETRQALLEDLDGIVPPYGSVSGAKRHRQYARAHELAVLADVAARDLTDRVREALGAAGPAGPFGCDTTADYSGSDQQIVDSTGLRLGWIEQACKVRGIAGLQLADMRADARFGWLEDEIKKLGEAADAR
ncbi:MAG: hypothetical protein V3S18_06520 [Dehalococcoidia bacterium]